MVDHIIEGALVAARDYLRQSQQDGTTYGYYPGGDPRNFSPDHESCTTAELEAHKAACEAWDRGERPEHERHRHEATKCGDATVVMSFAGAFGLGVYTIRDEEADDVLEQVEAALAALTKGHDR